MHRGKTKRVKAVAWGGRGGGGGGGERPEPFFQRAPRLAVRTNTHISMVPAKLHFQPANLCIDY